MARRCRGPVRSRGDLPVLAFASLWTNWTSVRKAKQGEIPADIFALLTCEPNAEVGRRKQRR